MIQAEPALNVFPVTRACFGAIVFDHNADSHFSIYELHAVSKGLHISPVQAG